MKDSIQEVAARSGCTLQSGGQGRQSLEACACPGPREAKGPAAGHASQGEKGPTRGRAALDLGPAPGLLAGPVRAQVLPCYPPPAAPRKAGLPPTPQTQSAAPSLPTSQAPRDARASLITCIFPNTVTFTGLEVTPLEATIPPTAGGSN